MGDSSSSSQSRSNTNSPTSVSDNPPREIDINVGGPSSPTNSPTLGLENTQLSLATRGSSSSYSIPTSSNVNINIPTIPITTTTTTTTTTITTTTTPPPVSTTLAIAPTQGQQGGPGESGRRKRGRPSTRGSSSGMSGGAGDKRGRGELDAPKNIDPTCSLCGKEFASWKAYFGHLRSHPDREWRGAFPPPTTLGPAVETLAPTLLRIAEETLASSNINVRVSNPQEGLGTSSSASRTGAGTSGTASATPSKFSFDLNELPPPEEEDSDDDGQEKKKDDKGKRKKT